MRIKKFTFKDFRGIREMHLDLQESSPTVLIGPNGAGKSSVLECLAILLSRLIGRIRSTSGTGRFFSPYDITNGRNETANEITVSIGGREYSWRVVKTRAGRKRQTITNLEGLKKVVAEINEKLTEDPKADVPIAVYYPVTRAVLDIPLRIRQKPEFDQLVAYDNALTSGRQDFRIFFAWFRNQEDIENQEIRKRRNYDYRDPQLEAVRQSVYKMLPGFSNLRVQRSPLRMVVTKKVEDGPEQDIFVNQLSDGEKCLLALVGDLARRLAIANPSRSDPLQGSGVALIDEVDLHLHPAWQRMVVQRLRQAFPNCQFVFTTHSPQVLSEVKSGNVYLLDFSDGEISAMRLIDSYGRDTNRILEEIMGVPERPQPIKDELRRYFRLLALGDMEEAKKVRAKIEEEIEFDEPKLLKADAMMRRKERAQL